MTSGLSFMELALVLALDYLTSPVAFLRCKVHKVMLHTLLASVNDRKEARRGQSEVGFTDDVLLFNEVYADGNESNTSEKISNYSEAFQVQLFLLQLSFAHRDRVFT